MSLVIHTICKDGLVVAADTRTTIHTQNGIRFDDNAEKIIPFPNKIVVSHCGNSNINDTLSVTKFLYDLREKMGEKITIFDLPIKLLTECIRINDRCDVTFKASGWLNDLHCFCTYTIETQHKKIELSLSPFQYGASYGGTTQIAHAIMNSGINYSLLSLNEAIDLTQTCLLTNIAVYKYHDTPVIGGKCQIYIIDILHSNMGWLMNDNTIKPDAENVLRLK